MSESVFTPEEVVQLWQHQFGPWAEPFDRDSPLPQRMHPFTCGDRSDHPVIADDKGVLVPTTRGWICPICDYTQKWAHGFMKGEREAKPPIPAAFADGPVQPLPATKDGGAT